MIYIAMVGAIFVLIGNNTKMKYRRHLVLSGMILTLVGIVCMAVFHQFS
jgi:hypothetical protein